MTPYQTPAHEAVNGQPTPGRFLCQRSPAGRYRLVYGHFVDLRGAHGWQTGLIVLTGWTGDRDGVIRATLRLNELFGFPKQGEN